MLENKLITNKIILIISPQEWNSIKLSKHHYAEELANANNKVYFINPVKSGLKYFSSIRYQNIDVVNIYLPLPYIVKFKIPFLYRLFLNFSTLIFLKLNKIKPDIVWDFDNTHQFKSYKIFNSKINIYHPVDATSNISIELHVRKPDIIFSVSPLILKNQKFNCPKYFINHGLSEKFIKQSQLNLLNYTPTNEIKNVGYSGNLDSHLISAKLFEDVANTYRKINFFFIGPYKANSKLVQSLSRFSNCYFTGRLNEEQLVEKMNKMDMFIYYYKSDDNMYFSDNSHKVLEYLSTGKIILGNKLLAYENNDLLIQADNEKDWLILFNEIITNTPKFTDATKFKQRIEFALANSYKNQIQKISNYLIQNKLL